MRWMFFFVATALAAADLDRDGLPDAFEQRLLERFAPQFYISAHDCDVEPSEFAAGERVPRATGRAGTLYGFVAPHPNGEIEVHYYHLWARDCGRGSHALDAEHVSALLRPTKAEYAEKYWRAVAWSAAGHQGTVCDTAHGARAHLLDAARQGPTVWISHGKHASFLSQARCARGCGGDSCEDVRRWTPKRIVNLGAPNDPLNGAVWMQSTNWSLAQKMRLEFTPSVVTVLDHSTEITNLYPVLVPVKATVLAGGSALGAIETGGQQAGAGMLTGASSVSDSIRKAKRAVGNLLNRWQQ